MGLAILAEALARIEHKLDLLLRETTLPGAAPRPQLHFVGMPCPLCSQVIDYQIDVTHGVVVRKCGCKTGKLPPLIPLVPIPGAQNGNPAASEDQHPGDPSGEWGPKNRTRR